MSNKIIIVAMTKDRVIGKDNTIPWHISDDLKLFKKNTTGHCIIMGRNTYESIGRPLPKRHNIVISNILKNIEGVSIFPAFKEAVDYAESQGTDIFFIGGRKVYQDALSLVDKLYVSHVNTDAEGDTFFPEIDLTKWEESNRTKYPEFDFVIYNRID